MSRFHHGVLAAASCLALFAAAPAQAGEIDCDLTFSMAGWSVF